MSARGVAHAKSPVPERAPSEPLAEPSAERGGSSARTWVLKGLLMVSGFVAAIVPFEIGFRAWVKHLPKVQAVNDRPRRYYAPTGSPSPSDFDYTIVKRPNTFRIAVVGDSFTFPTHMQFDDAFPKRLERMLNLNGGEGGAPSAEVMSFGQMGASSKSEVRTVERALKFQPDLILLQITLNDPEPKNLHAERSKHPERYDFGPLVITEATHPILYHWKSLGYLVQRFHNSGTLRAVIDYYRNMYRPDGRWRLFTRSLRKMKALADERGVPLVAVVFPLFYTPLDERYPFRDVHRQITDFLGSINVMNLDLFDSFAGMQPERLVVLPGEDNHPNEIAHRIAADAMYDWLIQGPVIPESLRVKDFYSRRGVHPRKDAAPPSDEKASPKVTEG